MKKITITSKVPIPRKARKGEQCYPFNKMKVGDSFYVQLGEGQKLNSLAAQLMSNAASYARIAQNGWKYSTRRDSKGVRVWRVE